MANDPLSAPGLEIWDDNGDLWGWEADPHFVIVTDDVDRASEALLAARERLLVTTYGGYEMDGSSDYDGTEDADTPNYVAPPEPHPEGVAIYADTKHNMTVRMRDHMVQIIVEELERHGVSARVEPR